MAKNYVQDGNVLQLTAPTGGVVSGGIYAIGTLVVIALATAAKDEKFAAATNGVWTVPSTAGLTAGAAVGLKAGTIVAAATADAVACGKLVTDTAGGFADLLLSN